MRAIIIGGGEVGQNIASTLIQERHEVIVVESDPERAAAFEAQMDAMVVTGNGGSPRLLQEIGAAKADLLLAVTHIDEVNIIAALAGHQLGVPRTVARVRDDDYFGGTDAFSRDVLGIDFIINPERATADAIAAAILLPGAVHVDYFADGLLAIAEVVLRPELAGRGRPDGRPADLGHPLRGRRGARGRPGRDRRTTGAWRPATTCWSAPAASASPRASRCWRARPRRPRTPCCSAPARSTTTWPAGSSATTCACACWSATRPAPAGWPSGCRIRR